MPDPVPALLRVVNEFRQRLARGDAAAAAETARFWLSAYRRAAEEVERAMEQAPGQQAFWTQRVAALRAQIAEHLDEAARASADVTLRRQAYAVKLAEQQVSATLAAANVPSAFASTFTTLQADVVERWLASISSSSSPVRRLFSALTNELADDALAVVGQALAYGWNPTTTARVLAQRYGIATTRALTITRTEQLRAYRDATVEQYRRSGVVESWIWHAALDSRTCLVCWAMHGTEHPLDSFMPTHPNCRCAIVPKLRNVPWTQPSGEHLFALQPERVQRAVLGPAAWQAWDRGLIDSLQTLIRVDYNTEYGPRVVRRALRDVLGQDMVRELLSNDDDN